MKTGHHQIRQHVFEVTFDSEATATEHQQEITDLLKGRLLSSVEKVFDEVCKEDHIIRLPRIEIDLGTINLHFLKSDLEYQLRQALKNTLEEKILLLEHSSSTEGEIIQDQKRTAEWLETFLTTGTIPWWGEHHKTADEIIRKMIVNEPLTLQYVIQNVVHNFSAVKRLRYHIKTKTFNILFNSLISGSTKRLPDILKGFHYIFSTPWFRRFNVTHLEHISFQIALQHLVKNTNHEVEKDFAGDLISHLSKEVSLTINEVIILLKIQIELNKDESLLRKRFVKTIDDHFTANYINNGVIIIPSRVAEITGEKLLILGLPYNKRSFVQFLSNKVNTIRLLTQLTPNQILDIIHTLFIGQDQEYVKYIKVITTFAEANNATTVHKEYLLKHALGEILRHVGRKSPVAFSFNEKLKEVIIVFAQRTGVSYNKALEAWKKILPQDEQKNKQNIFATLAEESKKTNSEVFLHYLVKGYLIKELSDQELIQIVQALILKPESVFSLIKKASIRQLIIISVRISTLNSLSEKTKIEFMKIVFKAHPQILRLFSDKNLEKKEVVLDLPLINYTLEYLVLTGKMPPEIRISAVNFIELLIKKNLAAIQNFATKCNAADLLTLLRFTKEGRKKEVVPGYMSTPRLKQEDKRQLPLATDLKKNDGLQLNKEVSAKEDEEIKTETSLYVRNAGIAILTPFLPRFFNMLRLLTEDKKEFKDTESKVKAIQLLHFLVFGTQDGQEYDMAINKLLVSLPIETPISPSFELTTDEIEISESLLKGVVQNWTVLKKSSIDNLRGSFLIRNGRLVNKEKHWEMKVEEKGFDILIDKMPWSMKIIKYPWMKKQIYVEWR